jgi:hypothetical protein
LLKLFADPAGSPSVLVPLILVLALAGCGQRSRDESRVQSREIAALRRELDHARRQNASIDRRLAAVAEQNRLIRSVLENAGAPPQVEVATLGVPPSFGLSPCDAYALRACACTPSGAVSAPRSVHVRADHCEMAHMAMMAWSATLASGTVRREAIADECVLAERDLTVHCGTP